MVVEQGGDREAAPDAVLVEAEAPVGTAEPGAVAAADLEVAGLSREAGETSPVVSAMMSSSAARAGGPPERKPQPGLEEGRKPASERPL